MGVECQFGLFWATLFGSYHPSLEYKRPCKKECMYSKISLWHDVRMPTGYDQKHLPAPALRFYNSLVKGEFFIVFCGWVSLLRKPRRFCFLLGAANKIAVNNGTTTSSNTVSTFNSRTTGISALLTFTGQNGPTLAAFGGNFYTGKQLVAYGFYSSTNGYGSTGGDIVINVCIIQQTKWWPKKHSATVKAVLIHETVSKWSEPFAWSSYEAVEIRERKGQL